MRSMLLPSCFCALLLSGGCTSHLIFAEQSNAGLKIQAGGDALSPYELSLGYRRGVVAAIPKQQPTGMTLKLQGTSSPQQVPTDANKATAPTDDKSEPNEAGGVPEKKVILNYDPNELMSMYSEFCANIGFDDPVEFHHLIVTGDAAVRLIAEADTNSKLRDALGDIKRCEKIVNPAPAANDKDNENATNENS